MNKRFCWIWILIVSLAVFETQANDMQDTSSVDIPCICSTDRIVLFSNDSTELRFWHTGEWNENDSVTWKADIGKISQGVNGTFWNIGPAEPGVYYARVQANNKEICSVRIVVASRYLVLRNGKRITGNSFLVGDSDEPRGFGLYSYFLIRRPSDQDKEKYSRIIASILRLNNTNALAKYIPKEELNNMFLLTNAKLPQYYISKISEGEKDAFHEAARWILHNYNYARVEAILSKINHISFPGPYILSVSDPAHIVDLKYQSHLLQNLALLPDHLIDAWMREFQNQAQNVRFWDTTNLRTYTFRLRLIIAVLASTIESVEIAGKKLLDWKKQLVELK